jgi:hypothetical protein
VSTRCLKCHDPSDATLCTNCTIALKVELGDVRALVADLDITLSRQDQLLAPYGNGPGGNENPLPYRPHVTEAAWVLHHTLYSWTNTLDGVQAPRGTFPNRTFPKCVASTGALARHLLVNIPHIRLRVDAGQLADEVTSAIHQARHAIDRPDDRRAYLGPCGAPLKQPGTTCRHEIYGMAWKTIAKCPSCGTTHNIAERQKWLLDVAHDRLGTSTEIAGFLRTAGLRCTPGQIRGYVARGRLQPAPDTHPPLYRMRDVLTAIQDRYAHRKPAAPTKRGA